MKKGILKLGTIGFSCLAGTAALIAGVVACGASGQPSQGIYYSTINQGSFSKRKDDKSLVAWIPWDKKYEYSMGAKGFIENALGLNEKGTVTSGPLKDYQVSFAFAGDAANAGAENSGSQLSSRLQAGELSVLPDILIGYPNVAANFAYVGLLHDFGDKAKEYVAPGYLFELNAIRLADGSSPSYTLPFAKTTDGIGFDVVVMAKILADTATAFAGQKNSFEVLVDSDQDRMIRMILATSKIKVVKGDNNEDVAVVDLQMPDIYSPNPASSVNGKVTYQWSEFTDIWQLKTASGGVWELDKPVVEKNFVFKNNETAKSALRSIDYSVDIFGNFKGMGEFAQKVKGAYDLARTADPADSTFVMGYDAFTNAIASYQYDVAGHSASNTFVNAGPVKVNGKQRVDALRYELMNPKKSASFIEAASWLSDGVRSGTTYLKYDNSHYGSELIKNHRLLFSIGSTNGFPFYVDHAKRSQQIKPTAKTNIGEIYYTLQPTKVDPGEAKHSVTNQGPSLFVLDTHGSDVGKKIADQILEAYGNTGAKVESGRDTGYWFESGYLYGNKKSHGKSTDYFAALSALVQNPLNWGETIGKKLLLEHLDNAVSKPDQCDIHYLPVNVHSYELLEWIKTIYQSSFVNFFQDSTHSMPDGAQIALRVIGNGTSSAWLRKADDDN